MKDAARRVSLAIAILVLCTAAVSAETGFLDFASPAFLAGGAASTSLESPPATLLNPAVAAGKQRTTIDLSYVALVDFSTLAWGGHVVNLGLTLPTPAGVLSTVGRFAAAGFPSLNWGALGGLHLSFAKDLFPDLYVGLGLGFEFGSDWALWGDLGFLSLVGDLGFLKDFRWGVSLRGLGKGYLPAGASAALSWPPVFTPAIGASFALLKADPFLITVNSDLSFPGIYNDIRFLLGVGFAAADVVFIDVALNLDVRQLFAVDPARSLPLGFGLAVKIKTDIKEKIDLFGATEQGWNQSEMKVESAAVPLQGGIWGIGLGANVALGVIDRSPPAVTLDTEGEKYISPNFDGVQDDLTLALAITDLRYVKGFRFVVQDEAGTVVRTILNKEDRAETRDFGSLWNRLLYVKKGIPIPDSIRWDGKSDAGGVVPDGRYRYYVEAWDDNDNLGKTALGTVTVDDTPPSIAVAAPYLIFSPNGDGNKDTLVLEQSGSVEDKWSGTIRDIAGKEIVGFTWENQAPPRFEWNGKDTPGSLSPDGVYSYRITATDRAGNAAVTQLENLIIDTQATPIQLAIDLSFFSPNGDKAKDAVTFTPQVPVTTGIESWTLAIADGKGAAHRTYAGTLSIPATIAWDGKDDAGAALAEGPYQATLAIRYVNGNAPSASSPPITIDVTAPTATTKAEYDVFSPNGDGAKDTVSIFQETSEELFWTAAFKAAGDGEVRTIVWRGRADAKVTWDGRADDGSLLRDGGYTYTLASTDRAGNVGSSPPIAIAIDTGDTPVLVATDLAAFSPNGDAVKDRVRFLPNVRVTRGIDAWAYRVRSESGTVVRTFTGKNAAPAEVAWDGIDEAGQRSKDGRYTVELEVTYANGNQPRVLSNPFALDTGYPDITVTAGALLFSPDGDGRLDSLAVKQISSDETLWEGEIKNAKGEKVRGLFWKGKAGDFSWDGKDENGNRAPDGFYTYAVKAQRPSGNLTAKELRGIQIDTRQTPIYITPSATGFSPDGNGVKDDITFNLLVSLKEGIRSWKVSMLHPTAGVQKEFTGAAPVPATLTWDGKVGYQSAPEGSYTAVLTVEYAKGNLPEARTAAFRLDVSPPKASLAPGPLPFSPDNDGFNDELTISLKVEDASPIDSWELAILDPQRHLFNRVAGKGAPSEKIIWDGTSDTGELVQSAEDYYLVFTIKDDLGKASTTEATVPVDILVIRVGDQLKVRIPSITFAPNTPDYINVDAEKALKNEQVISRLAEIFKKFSKYKILIVGHANRDKYDPAVNVAGAKKEQDEELLPLSKQRADAIRTALTMEGIEARRITTEGKGGAEPIVAFSDRDNWWKNRRVEFILVRE